MAMGCQSCTHLPQMEDHLSHGSHSSLTICIGLFNWMGEDNRLNQTTPAMHHVTMMGVSLFCQIVENDIKVCLFTFS